MPIVNDRMSIRNGNPLMPAVEIHQKPADLDAASDADAVYIRQWGTSGRGHTLFLHSDNSVAPALTVRSAGPLLRMYDATDTLKFQISNTGAVTLYDTLSLTSLTTTGAVSVGGNATVTGTLAVTSTTTLTGNVTMTNNATVGGTLGVTGTSTVGVVNASGNVTVTGADLQITGTGKAYRFRRGGGGLDLEATGADLVVSNWSGTNFDGTQRSYFRLSADALNTQIAGKVEFVDALYGSTKHVLDGTANTIGFFGTAAAAKQSVSGSRGGNAALASLLTALATYGLVTDGTTA